MEGTLELVAGDGRRMAIDAGTTRARRPVAQLKPRVYSAVTTTPIRFASIDSSGFSEITPAIETDDYLVAELQEGIWVQPVILIRIASGPSAPFCRHCPR